MNKTIKLLSHDNRFFIDDENLGYLRTLGVYKYDVDSIKLGQILRDYEDGLYPISHALPYRFIINPDDAQTLQEYERYCRLSRNQIGIEDRSPEAFLSLKKEVLANGYDLSRGAIVIDQFNIIVEGQHRCCILLDEYGANHRVNVVRVWRFVKNPRTLWRLWVHGMRRRG